MVKLGAFLGYSFSSLGIGLFVITSFFIFAWAKYPGASDVIYPYRVLAGPSLVTGLLFLILEYLVSGLIIQELSENKKHC
jgi:hypothetical protein